MTRLPSPTAVPTALAALLAAGLAAASAPPAAAGWWEQAAEARPAELREILRAPEQWKDVPVLLDVRVAGASPVRTDGSAAFDGDAWRNVRLLPAGDGGPAVAPGFDRAFVRRGSVEERRAAAGSSGGKPGFRALVRASVRDVVGGEPWLEVLDVVAEGDGMSPEEEARARRAESLLRSENPVAAERELRSLLEGRDYGAAVRASLWRLVGRACRDQRRFADAAAALRQSLELQPDEPSAVADLRDVEARAAREKSGPRDGKAAAVESPGTPIPVPDVAKRLAGPRDLVGPPASDSKDPPAAKRSDGAPSVATGLAPVFVPVSAPAALPVEEPPPPPARRLAEPR